jgi:outer membrane murein-binding lipoprotein Lpp
MDQNEDPRELERKIEQASRIASTLTDQSTELRQGLRQRLAEPRAKKEINARARTLGARRETMVHFPVGKAVEIGSAFVSMLTERPRPCGNNMLNFWG